MATIIVQEIIVQWSQRSRGVEAAKVRNAIPETFAVPYFPAMSYVQNIVHDKVTFEAGTRHILAVKEFVRNKRVKFGCTRLSWDGNRLVVTYSYDPWCGGAPRRSTAARTVLALPVDSWGQIRYNGRFGYEGWTYKKTVLNIAYLNTVRADIFLSEPARVFTDMADLW